MRILHAGILVLLLHSLFHSYQLNAQSTPQPTAPSGSNRVARSPDGRTYSFYYNGILLYRYDVVVSGRYNGTFVGLSASANGTSFFSPSMCGGVLAVDGGRIVYPCEGEVMFRLIDQFSSRDSVMLSWKMYKENREIYAYRMSFIIKGRTLVIDVAAEGDNRNGAGITLGEATGRPDDLVVVPVPYLTLTNLLLQKSSKNYLSMFFDWERTRCSRLLPLSPQQGHTIFASSAEYFPLTDGRRNRLSERIYLTISGNLDEVMPNVPAPQAPLRKSLQDKIVVSYHPPYHWLLNSIVSGSGLPSYLDTLKNLGIRDVALLVKDWWWSGFDKGNPSVLPANDFLMQREGWDCFEFERQGGGGDDVLRAVRDKARSYGFVFGLHQNYVDMYTTARPGALPAVNVDSTLLARLPDVGTERAWAYPGNCRGENAFAVKPARVVELAGQVASDIHTAYALDWNYLDVTSSLNPSGPLPLVGHGPVNSVVDFDASPANPGRDSAGMFLYTLRKYREVPGIVRRKTNNGPVQGEGGNHFLYAGYFDDLEARIKTARADIGGHKAPLFLNFHLNKLRGKSSYHGAGHIYEFYDRGWGAFFTDKDLLEFVATELAYGHGGLVTKSAHNCVNDALECDHSLRHIALEANHVLPLQKLLANASVRNITYYDARGVARTASQYIAEYPDGFADFNSSHFMGRVRIEYSNGVVVYVNRNREAGSWTIRGLPSGRRYNYNILRNGRMVQGTGPKPAEPLVLPAECGWVWY